MADTVFPNKMDDLDPDKVRDALGIVEEYIHYMCERVDFSMANVFSIASKAGNSGAAVIVEVEELKNEVSAMSSQLGAMQGRLRSAEQSLMVAEQNISSLQTQSTDYDQRITNNTQNIADNAEDIEGLSEGLETTNNNLSSLDGRVNVIDGRVQTAEEGLNNLTQASAKLDEDIHKVDTDLRAALVPLAETTANVDAFMGFDTDNGILSISAKNQQGDGFETRLSSQELGFYENGQRAAWISGQMLYQHYAVIENAIKLGYYEMQVQDNGRVCMVWVGAN